MLVWSALLHCFYYYMLVSSMVANEVLGGPPNRYIHMYLLVSCAQIVSLLMYPVAGLVGEIIWTRYKVMTGGTVLVVVGLLLYPPTAYYYVVKYSNQSLGSANSFQYGMEGASFISLVVYQLGMAVFEANALQLGADQLQFGSSQDLSTFVHWYYWTTQGIYAAINFITAFIPNANSVGIISVYQPGVQLVMALLGLFLVVCFHRSLIKEPVSRSNPIRLIHRVLKFARQHKKPIFRSAFTYGENPSHLDIAKERYGGPFTTNQVEDVKSFWRILLVLICSYGFMLARDENSVLLLEYLNVNVNSPKNDINLLTKFMPTLGFLFICLIPIYQLILRPLLKLSLPSMLKRIALGLIAATLSLTTKAVLTWILHQDKQNSAGSASGSGGTAIFNALLLLIPYCLQYTANILVSLSALEFILAQAPRSMQGLLIRVWYAFNSIGVVNETASFLSGIYNNYTDTHIRYSARACLALISVVLFVAAGVCYTPRQRNEVSVVNERQIIEEYTERQLNRETYYRTQKNRSTSYYCVDFDSDNAPH